MRVKHRPITTVQLALSGSYTTIFAANANTDNRVNLTVCNDTSTPITFSLWKVASGDSPGDDNLVVNSRMLADKESYVVLELIGLVFGPSETLQGSASVATQATVTGGYIEYTRVVS